MKVINVFIEGFFGYFLETLISEKKKGIYIDAKAPLNKQNN